jgi:tetratricopeptide (TPR) repeat protein
MSWSEDEKSIDLRKISQMTLVDFMNERKHTVDEIGQELPRVIIFDQFEEIFSSYQDRWKDRAGFFGQVRDAFNIPFLKVVFVMREEFIAQLDPYVNLLPEKLRTRFRLEHLNKEAALLAVKEPMKNTGRYFAEWVAEKMVDDLLKIRVETDSGKIVDVTGEFIEAVLLQVICQKLWQRLPVNVKEINMSHLNSFGNMDKALSIFYEEALQEAAKISLIHEEELRKWCEKNLITHMGTRNTVYRYGDFTGEIPNEAIDVLERKYLIRAEIRAGVRWYELIHDKLIKPILSSNKSYRSKVTDSKDKGKEPENKEANQVIMKAEQAWEEKNYEEALIFFEEALAIYENIDDSVGRVNTYIDIGNIYYYTEKYALMIEKCEQALEIDQNNAAAYYNWGRSLHKISRYDEAIEKLQKSIEIVLDYVNTHNGGSNSLKDIKLILARFPIVVDAYNVWGNALSDLKKYDEAIEKYKKAIEIDPNYVLVWYNWGIALSDLKKYDEAIKIYKKAIEIDPNYVDAYNVWGIALSDLKKYDEAIEKYEKVIEIDPNFAAAWYNKASSLCLANGDIEEISTCLARAIELDSFYIQMAEEDLVFKSVKNQMWFKNLSN